MNVISLSLDPHLFQEDSVAALRARAYGTVVDTYTVVVPTPAKVRVALSDSVSVYGAGGSSKVLQLFAMYTLLKRLVTEKECDVITAQDAYFLGFLAYILAHRFHLGFEIQILGLEKLSPIRKILATFLLKRASVVRALSHRLKGRLVSEFSVPESQIRVVTIFVDVEKLGLDMRTLSDSDQRAYRELSDTFKQKYGKYTNFVTVSRLVSIKNIPMQLDALKELIAEVPDVRLHIVGGGPEEKELQEAVGNRSLDEYVIFHGPQYGYALGMFYIAGDCFLLTSNYEGWGMVIIEAATAGLPIIMTDVGCAGELIIDGESGIVVPVGDTRALKTAMKQISTDQRLRDRLSQGGTKVLHTLPDFDTVLEQYKDNWEYTLAHRL